MLFLQKAVPPHVQRYSDRGACNDFEWGRPSAGQSTQADNRLNKGASAER